MGKKKIDTNLNVIRLVQNLNFIKIFTRKTLLTEKVRWQVAHCEKNRINLDSESLSEDSQDEFVEIHSGDYKKDNQSQLRQRSKTKSKAIDFQDKTNLWMEQQKQGTTHSRNIKFEISSNHFQNFDRSR